MTDRDHVRMLLDRWAQAIPFCKKKEREMAEIQDIIDAQRGVSCAELTGMPRGSNVSRPTECAAERIESLNDFYRQVLIDIANEADERMRFKRSMDKLIAELLPEQQKVIELRYECDHAWVYIATRMNYSVDRAKHIEAEAIDELSKGLDVSTF